MATVFQYLTHAGYCIICCLHFTSFKHQNNPMRESNVIMPSDLTQGSLVLNWINPSRNFTNQNYAASKETIWSLYIDIDICISYIYTSLEHFTICLLLHISWSVCRNVCACLP